MDFNFNGQYPFQWSGSFIPSSFNNTNLQAHSSNPLPVGHVPAPPPGPTAAGPPVFLMNPNTASGTAMPGFNRRGMFPFGVHGSYPNQNPAHQSFHPKWNYGVYSNMSHFNQLPQISAVETNSITSTQDSNCSSLFERSRLNTMSSNVSVKENAKTSEN